jgi:hypothetical protein
MTSYKYQTRTPIRGQNPTQDYYRDKMLELADARASALIAEKKKREKLVREAEQEDAGKWGDIAMVGASIGGMLGAAAGPGGTGVGMGIGAGIGAGLGLLRAATARHKPKGSDLLRGTVPSTIMAATGASSAAQVLAAENARRGGYMPQRQDRFAAGLAGMQQIAQLGSMGARAAGAGATPQMGLKDFETNIQPQGPDPGYQPLEWQGTPYAAPPPEPMAPPAPPPLPLQQQGYGGSQLGRFSLVTGTPGSMPPPPGPIQAPPLAYATYGQPAMFQPQNMSMQRPTFTPAWAQYGYRGGGG